jgi:acylphosphatase
MEERLEAIVSGRVQMVMYRDFVQRKARSLKLVGEVQNMMDGTVRVVAEGSRKALEALVTKLCRGSLLAHVASVQTIWLPATGEYTTFTLILPHG